MLPPTEGELEGCRVIGQVTIPALLLAAGLNAENTAALRGTWRDISVGIPPGDDISYFTFGDTDDEMFVGTRSGYVWRTRDGGQTWMWIFRPLVNEPIAIPQLKDVRAPTVGDLGLGQGREIQPRERQGEVRRHADLAGTLRSAPRERGAPLLGSIVRPEVVDPADVENIRRCGPYIFLSTDQGLFRSRDDGAYFEPLHVGPTLDGWVESWVSCDPTHPGRLIVNGEGMVFESHDWGDSFYRYTDPLPRSPTVQTVTFDPEGRLLIVKDGRVYRERRDHRGYDRVCMFVADSIGSTDLRWAWWVNTGRVFGVTSDGVLKCEGQRSTRLHDLRLGGEDIRFIWIDEPRLQHIFVATERAVYESFDGGGSFTLAYTARTQRSIRRIAVSDREGDLVVVTGGQIFRRIPDAHSAFGPARVTERLSREVPLWQVVNTALERAGLLPSDLASQRTDVRLRALLPRLQLRASYNDDRAAGDFERLGADLSQTVEARRSHGGVWSVFAYWDLGDILHDALQSDPTWADLQRLRAKITYGVQDQYATWVRAQAALAEEGLSPWVQAYNEIVQREAAAYLHQMTGGAFAAFAPGYGAKAAQM